jgi:hypothetical protein
MSSTTIAVARSVLFWLPLFVSTAVAAQGDDTKSPPPAKESAPPPKPALSEAYAAAAKVLHSAARADSLPAVGDEAPDFRLKLLEGSSAPEFVVPSSEGRVRLRDHSAPGRSDRVPVVLIFGSFT